MPEIGIVMTLNDRLSSALKTIAGNVKAFDKDLDELDATFKGLTAAQEGLIDKQTGLKKALEASNVKVIDARKEYKKLKDETSKGALDAAIEEQALLQKELKSTEAEIRLNNKAYEALEKSAIDAAKGIREVETRSESAAQGMKEDARTIKESMGSGDGILKKLKDSELSKMIGGAVTDVISTGLESALGQPMATAVESTLSGITQGVSAGALFGPTGMVIGGAIGAVTGGLQGWTAVEQAKDDSFKSYVQESVEGQLAEMDSIRASGSATAGQREQDQIAFAQRFGSEESARDYLNQVKAMAVNTNYSYDEITGYSKSLLNTYNPEDTLKVLQDLSDATAGLNLDSSGVSMFINGLARMRTTDKATQEYLNYFSERGLDVYEALSRSTGADKSNIAGMVSKGDISGTDAAQAILNYIQEEFGGLSETLASTYDAMVDNLGDAEANLNAMMGEGYNEARKAGIEAQSNWLESDELGEAYKSIGAWKASLENAKEQYIRDAVDAAMGSEEYKTAQAEGDAAEMGRIIMQAKINGMNEYNANEGKDEVLAQELALIEGVRNDTALNSGYWDAGYTLGQEFSKGRAAALAETGDIFSSDPYLGPGASSYRPSAHAFGLERVPYDDYPALLHEGERVLTASQAREQDREPYAGYLSLLHEGERAPAARDSQEQGRSGAPVINVTVSGNTFGAGMDEAAVAQAIANELRLQFEAGGGR